MAAVEKYDAVHPLTKKVGKNPPCWNNRKPLEAEYMVEDRSYIGGRWVKSTRIIVSDWLDSGKCQQPGVGYKPNSGCIECEFLNQQGEVK